MAFTLKEMVPYANEYLGYKRMPETNEEELLSAVMDYNKKYKFDILKGTAYSFRSQISELVDLIIKNRSPPLPEFKPMTLSEFVTHLNTKKFIWPEESEVKDAIDIWNEKNRSDFLSLPLSYDSTQQIISIIYQKQRERTKAQKAGSRRKSRKSRKSRRYKF